MTSTPGSFRHVVERSALAALTAAIASCACPASSKSGLVVWVIGGAEAPGTGLGGVPSTSTPGSRCLASVTVLPEDEVECWVVGDDCNCATYFGRSGRVEVSVRLNRETERQSTRIRKGRCDPKTETLCFFGDCPD